MNMTSSLQTNTAIEGELLDCADRTVAMQHFRGGNREDSKTVVKNEVNEQHCGQVDQIYSLKC